MGNPILGRVDTFTKNQGGWPQQGYGQPPGYVNPQFQNTQFQNTQFQNTQFQQQGYQQPGYQQFPQGYQQAPGQQPFPGQAPYGYQPQPQQGVMTMEDVIAKTAIVLGAIAVVAGLSWALIPDALMLPSLILSSLVGLVTVMIVAFKKQVSPALVMTYALIEGVFIGMFSKMFELAYPGIVTQAVMATFVTAGATLAAYRFFNIKVTPKFQKVVFIATAGFAGAMLINFLLSLAGIDLGLRSGLFGIIAALIGSVLAVLNLVTDFDMVERGVANRAPASQSWIAAFGIAVTMVWLYTELLRILSYFRD